MSSSLGRRIGLGVVGITSVVVLIAATGIWFASRHVLWDGIDRELDRRVELLRQIGTEPAEAKDHIPIPSELLPCRSDSRNLLEIVSVAGRHPLARSLSLAKDLSLHAADDQPTDSGSQDRLLPDGRQVRLRRLVLGRMPPLTGIYVPSAASGRPVIAYVAIDPAQEHAELAVMAWALAALWLAATALAWGAVWLVRPAILRPLAELRTAIVRLGPDDLSGRIPETAAPEEVQGVVLLLNGLLAKLDDAFRREHTTIAGIAHELRTPVSELRALIEFRQLAKPPAEEGRGLDACLAIVLRMQQLVDDLLLLARLESGSEPLQREACDLAALVADAVEPWEAHARQRRLRILCELPDTAQVTTSPRHLRLLLGNLIGNAVMHAPEGGDIGITVLDGNRVQIRNACPNPVDVACLGRPFYRGDASRTGAGHCGLGLALCRRLAALLSAELSLAANDGAFTARLRLPAT